MEKRRESHSHDHNLVTRKEQGLMAGNGREQSRSKVTSNLNKPFARYSLKATPSPELTDSLDNPILAKRFLWNILFLGSVLKETAGGFFLMRFFLFMALIAIGPILVASGFTIPKGELYTKLDYKFLDAEKSYDNKGNLTSDQLGFGIENDAVNLFVGYGLSKHFSLTADVQYVKTVFDLRSNPTSNQGITDIWVDLQAAVYQKKFNVVANLGVKLPQQKNQLFIPFKPALSSGEEEYSLSLAMGYGARAYFVEGELGHVWRSGFVSNVTTGVRYENSWEGNLKMGWHARSMLDLEGLLVTRQSVGDLDTRYIPGVFANSDETLFQLSLNYLPSTRSGIGLYGERTLAGKNIQQTESIGINIFYRWSR